MKNAWAILFILLTGCGEAGQHASRITCEYEGERAGRWSFYAYPTTRFVDPALGIDMEQSTTSEALVTDDEGLFFVGDSCEYCSLRQFDLQQEVWLEPAELEDDIIINARPPGPRLVLSDRYLAAVPGAGFETEYPSDVFVLERETLVWKRNRPPERFDERFPGELYQVGREFLLWGSQLSPVNLDDDSLVTMFYDGILLDPETGVWTDVPELTSPTTFVYGEEDWRNQFASIWSEDGMFVWGVERDETPLGAVYSPESGWTRLPQEDAPPARVGHRLLYSEGYVYLFSGTGLLVGNNRRQPGEFWDLWRYSLNAQDWEEIEVPDFVDLYNAEGTALENGLLVFSGTVCIGAAILDPTSLTWSRTPTENAPRIDPEGSLSPVWPFVSLGNDAFQAASNGLYGLDHTMYRLNLD